MPRATYSLRILLVGVTLTCLALAWVTPAWQLKLARDEFWPKFNDHDFSLRACGYLNDRTDNQELPLILHLLGERPERTLLYNPLKDPDGRQLKQARELFPEAKIWTPRYWKIKEPLPQGVRWLPEDAYIRI